MPNNALTATSTDLTCAWEDVVDDADFGFWDSTWGDSLQVVRCRDAATVTVTDALEDDVALCSFHAERAEEAA